MEGAAHSLVSNGGQLLAEQYRQLRGVRSEVAELRDDLATMNALLRMQSEAEDGAADPLRPRVDEAAARARLRLGGHHRPLPAARQVPPGRQRGATRFRHLLRTLFSRRRLAAEINALRARAVAIGDRHARYGVDREALRRCRSAVSAAPPLAPRRANNNADAHQLVGIDGQVHALAGRLKARADGERLLKVLSVVGFGGLGKTTLALELCRRVEADFERQAMVSVSQAFEPGRDLRPLLKRLLRQLVKPTTTDNDQGIKEEGTLGDIEGLDDDKLAKKLEELLNDKR
ncbi:hypothetical protein PR202_ga28171 [Eleusine coracana subsp. coracana]|uniref:NB-ARC domain-containing protein n=1 Tax=Eleusine coracana subsp. coracana TaxID=191504 RepID=A0AAV5DJ35_ELECO|nr:hypothetical protein PR202_ga28171 [Eleusine coracana subsp. coracana]